MVRLFKHYVPHAVLLLGLVDVVLLLVAAEAGWVLRAHQIGMAVTPLSTRVGQLVSFAAASGRTRVPSRAAFVIASSAATRIAGACCASAPR